jgi:hypothetical protein
MLQQSGAGCAPALEGVMPFMDQAEIARSAVDQTLPTGLDLGREIRLPDQGPGHGHEVGVA